MKVIWTGKALFRHPFSGPGLGIRVLGDITPEKVRILQDADYHAFSALIPNCFLA